MGIIYSTNDPLEDNETVSTEYNIIGSNVCQNKETKDIIDKYHIDTKETIEVEEHVEDLKRSVSLDITKKIADEFVDEIMESASKTYNIELEKSVEINLDKLRCAKLERQLIQINEKYDELFNNYKKILHKYNRLKRKYKFD